jgi:DNA-binding CsgD family transcriptional regulator
MRTRDSGRSQVRNVRGNGDHHNAIWPKCEEKRSLSLSAQDVKLRRALSRLKRIFLGVGSIANRQEGLENETREQQILRLVAQGLTDKQMAAEMGISVETVGSYWRRILTRFDASSRTEVIAKVLRREFRELEEQCERFLFELGERARVERLLRDANIRLYALMSSLRSGVLFEDSDRIVLYCNEAFCHLFGIPKAPRELEGRDCRVMAMQGALFFADPEGFLMRLTDILAAGEPVHSEPVHLADGRVLLRDYVPIFTEGEQLGHMWHYIDVSATLPSA